MRTIVNPSRQEWANLCERPTIENATLNQAVTTILEDVKRNGDEAIFRLEKNFDKVELKQLLVSKAEINFAISQVSEDLKLAIQLAKNNIERFHASQKETIQKIETTDGVVCWRKSVAIEKVGLYIPGGTAPLFSTVLMLGIPAKLAGCKEIILCTPPSQDESVNATLLYTANLIGIEKIYKIGGAQAIAAMTFGTESVVAVDKIFGPGNQFVTKAKELAQLEGISIDMPAGPSELLVISDVTANPEFVASDLLSQAEHGIDSQVLLLSDNQEFLAKTKIELDKQLALLPRKDIAAKALKNSISIAFSSIEDCMMFSNQYAPEHLILAVNDAEKLAESVYNAGSVFLGNYSCESAGDYASGTNHTLPTNGYARQFSGVSLDSFVRKITFQNITEQGIQAIGPAIELMAEAEELFAHKNAVTVRLNALKNV